MTSTSQNFNRSSTTGQPICKCGKGYGSEYDGLCTRCRGKTAHDAKTQRENDRKNDWCEPVD